MYRSVDAERVRFRPAYYLISQRESHVSLDCKSTPSGLGHGILSKGSSRVPLD